MRLGHKPLLPQLPLQFLHQSPHGVNGYGPVLSDVLAHAPQTTQFELAEPKQVGRA
jgi:hypothetical protein